MYLTALIFGAYELKSIEKTMLGVLIIAMLGILISAFRDETMCMIFFSGITLFDVLLIKKNAGKRFQKNNLEIMKRYESLKIKSIAKMLKEESIGLYRKNEIKWIISMCERFCIENSKKELFTSITAFFSTIIFPILAATATLIVKDMETIDVLKLATQTSHINFSYAP